MTLPGFGAAPNQSTTPTTQQRPGFPHRGPPKKPKDAGLGLAHGYPWCHRTMAKGLGQDWGGGLHSCRELWQEGPCSEEADPKAPGG